MWDRHHVVSEFPPDFSTADLPVRLRLGEHEAILRWLEPKDTGPLVQLFAAEYEDAAHHHTLAARLRLHPDQTERLVSIDQQRDVALGIFVETDREPRLCAVGQYFLGIDDCSAEASLVVHDEHRESGISTLLLHALIAIATERRLEQLVVHVRPDNNPMLQILRAAGATVRPMRGTPLQEAVLRTCPAEAEKSSRRVHAKSATAAWSRTAAARTALRIERASEALQRLPTP